MQLKKVYRNNKEPIRQVVLLALIEQGHRVLAESCLNRRKIKIPVREIHDRPYESGWSLVQNASAIGSNGGGP